MCFNL